VISRTRGSYDKVYQQQAFPVARACQQLRSRVYPPEHFRDDYVMSRLLHGSAIGSVNLGVSSDRNEMLCPRLGHVALSERHGQGWAKLREGSDTVSLTGAPAT